MRTGRASEWFIAIMSSVVIAVFAAGWCRSELKLRAMENRAEALIDAGFAKMDDGDDPGVKVASANGKAAEPRWVEAAEWDRLGMGRRAR
ncbi:MAG: hypothetical protein WCP22_03255 [Chlamydiota bacterium]